MDFNGVREQSPKTGFLLFRFLISKGNEINAKDAPDLAAVTAADDFSGAVAADDYR